MQKTILFIVLLFFVCQFTQVKAQSTYSDTTKTEQTVTTKKPGIFSWISKLKFWGKKDNVKQEEEAPKANQIDYSKMELDELNFRFIVAAIGNDTDSMIKLLSYGASINATNTQGRTALIEVSRVGKFETAKWLIDRGANVNYKDMYDGSAIIYATQAGKRDIVKLLLKHGARRDFDF